MLPPPSMFSSSSIAGEPGRVKSSFTCPLDGNVPESPTATSVAVVPSTRGWLPPTNRPMVPSSAGICVVCTYWLISRMTCSRWSSRSLGVCPLPVARAICSLIAAICLARLLTVLALFFSSSVTVYWISLMRSAEVRMRDAVSSMRVSTRVRADRSVGAATTSENAFIMSVMAAPNPVGPPPKISCSWLSRCARTVSPALTDPAAAAWRVSNSLWLRKMVRTSTPCPM